jgi:hypothetical protein
VHVQVAVKVLDGADVLRRDAASGLSLEALLSSGLKHPGVVATMAWAVVSGKVRAWRESPTLGVKGYLGLWSVILVSHLKMCSCSACWLALWRGPAKGSSIQC